MKSYDDVNKIFSRTKLYFKRNFSKLKKATVAVLGLGGVGSFAAEFLARVGVNLILVDHDKVDATNLGRQNYSLRDVGRFKAEALKEKISKISSVSIEIKCKHFEDVAEDIVKRIDILLAAFDSLKPVKLLNRLTFRFKKPYVNASAILQQGEILFVLPHSACIECLYPKMEDSYKASEVGVDPIVPTLIGLMAAEMILNYLAFGISFENKLYRFDFKHFKFYEFKIKKRENCEREFL